MPRTKDADVEEVVSQEGVVGGTSAPEPITPISHDFSRDDLNEMRDKVNELIARSNS